MSLSGKKGDEVTLEVNGENEVEALKELGEILEAIHE